ncbi:MULTISPECIES: hypothetical protein [unclassified Bacillus (in: firmicutes)]|uniref:hypothetical protein n=1 Tax=unclassified Bacillus (in: firmicutes) TaxID=185979 RepID=UPI0008F15814|nr:MULTISPECIES: hypothetical protein [unclassified Bacillus (in: firmicutes)]SFA99614.1 hypothetical protein SAMN02799634_103455 [Bacillus sp. UNCCL13]SFQ81727.1 hypothetical protein SAMN04488577_2086 [Bacillus sp. cl95]
MKKIKTRHLFVTAIFYLGWHVVLNTFELLMPQQSFWKISLLCIVGYLLVFSMFRLWKINIMNSTPTAFMWVAFLVTWIFGGFGIKLLFI